MIIKIDFLNEIFRINTLATGHFASDRLQPGAPPFSNIFLFNKATFFFLHQPPLPPPPRPRQQKIVRKMEDRTAQKFQRGALTLYQYFLLLVLSFSIFSTPNKIRINSFSARKKSYFEEKANSMLQLVTISR